MFKAIFAIAFVVVAVSAGPMMGPPGGPGGMMGGPGGPGGPFKELESGLSEEQKQQLQAIFKNESATKQQTKDSLKSFFDGIGGDVATKFNEMQTKMDSMKSEMESKASEATSSLSDAAKQLTTQMKAIHDNMSLTPAQERDQIKALFDGASDEVKNELKSAKGQFMPPGMMGGPEGPGPMMGPPGGPGGMMGGPGGPGGPLKELESGLSEEQKQQLQAIFKNESATKQQTKDSLKSFFDGIGGDVATKFNEMQTKMDSMKSEMESKASEATSNLSDAAKQLTTQMKAIHDNMSLTPAQERDQIKALFDGASDEVKNELKYAKGQFLPPGMMGGPGGPEGPGGPGGPGGFPHYFRTTPSA